MTHKFAVEAEAEFRKFLKARADEPFLAEDFVSTLSLEVDDGRVFGPLMKSFEAAGLIVQVGFARAITSNKSPKVLWRRA